MKKQVYLFLIILFAGLTTYAQDTKFSATVGYPIAVGDNFLKSYTGIVDVGAQVRFLKAGPVHLGVPAPLCEVCDPAVRSLPRVLGVPF